MRSRRRLVFAVLGVFVLLAADPALAAPFTPTTTFALSTRKVNANPSLTIKVNQNAGEEELDKVVLVLAKGFKIPLDAAINQGEVLGSGQIKIAAEPLCSTASQQTVNVRIIERDRNTKQKNAGVKAVWRIDLEPVVTINLLWRGSNATGWRGSGNIPSNNATCPPFEFKATINKTSSASHVKIIRNPSNPGTYVLKAIWTGVDGSHKTNQKSVQITN